MSKMLVACRSLHLMVILLAVTGKHLHKSSNVECPGFDIKADKSAICCNLIDCNLGLTDSYKFAMHVSLLVQRSKCLG